MVYHDRPCIRAHACDSEWFPFKSCITMHSNQYNIAIVYVFDTHVAKK